MDTRILTHINAGQEEAENINRLEKFSQVATYQSFPMMFNKRIINDLQVFFEFLSCFVRRCLLFLQLSQGLADTRLDIVRNDFSSFIADRKVGFRRQFSLSSGRQTPTPLFDWLELVAQVECFMQNAGGQFHVFFVNQDGYFDFGS